MLIIAKRCQTIAIVVIASMVIVLLYGNFSSAWATNTQESIVVNRNTVVGSYVGDNNGFAQFETSEGDILYDYDLDRVASKTGTAMQLTDEWDVGVQIILDSTPRHAGPGREEITWYIVQSAIWWYRDGEIIAESFLNGREAYPGIVDDISSLVQIANEAASKFDSLSSYYADKLLSISFSSENIHYVVVDGMLYFETPTITVGIDTPSTSRYSINVAENIQVIDSNSITGRTTFPSGYSFRLRIPAEYLNDFLNNPKITISSDVSVSRMQVYQSDDPSLARLVYNGTNVPISIVEDIDLPVDEWTDTLQATVVLKHPWTEIIVMALFCMLFGTMLLIINIIRKR